MASSLEVSDTWPTSCFLSPESGGEMVTSPPVCSGKPVTST